jgi:RecJ-like exonuclease
MQILSHEDADGICSASLIRMTDTNSRVFFTKPCSLLHDLGSMDTQRDLVVLDIALCEPTKENVVRRLARWGGQVLYIDHHPGTAAELSKAGSVKLVTGDTSTAELTFRHLDSSVRREAERVMLMGAIGDYSDLTPFCVDLMNRWDKRSVFLQAGFLCGALEVTRPDHDFHREMVDLLASCRQPCEDNRIVTFAVKASEIEESFRQRVEKNAKRLGQMGVAADLDGPAGKGATYAAAATGTSIGAYIDRSMKRGIADISFRVIDSSVDLNEILRKAAPPLGGSGGGHAHACGARVPLEKVDGLFSAVNQALASR